jgi:hypothetical protein
LRRTALNAGYDEGVKEGRKDRGNGSRTEHRNLSSYQKATKDYSSRLGVRLSASDVVASIYHLRDNHFLQNRNTEGTSHVITGIGRASYVAADIARNSD